MRRVGACGGVALSRAKGSQVSPSEAAEYFIPPWPADARSGETVKESGLPLPRARREASLTGS